ncbi:MAG TPA: HDOD domain-containing protein [Steroidobacteraceae bacterium]|nr:HDOD domain-containing protein [Steroidobacteraceae bacterium]
MPKPLLLLVALIAVLAVTLAAVLLKRRGQPGERPRAGTAPPRALRSRATAAAGRPTSPSAPASQGAADVIARLHEVAFGLALQSPASEPAHTAVATAVQSLLSQPLLKAEYAPRRPLLLPKLMRAVNDDEVSRREIAVLIATDPALAGNLLRLANTPVYRRSAQPVESIDRAVAVLGTNGMRSLIAAALIQPVFRMSPGEFKRFADVTWEHTQYSATAAEAHAALIADTDPFAGQLLGLLVGLGAIMVYRATMDQYATSRARPDAATVAALVDRHAPLVARRIARDWELSERILTALEEQSPSGQVSTPLGDSLRFGRYCGAVALLRREGLMDEETGLAALRDGGFSGVACERIWARLSKQIAASEATSSRTVKAHV